MSAPQIQPGSRAAIIQTFRNILAEARANKDKAGVMSATKRLKQIAAFAINPNP